MSWLPNYLWSRFCGWALTAAVVAMGVAGVYAMFQPAAGFLGRPAAEWCVAAFAAVAAFSIANGNNHAAHAMAAVSAEEGVHWPTVVLSTVCVIGFAFAAGISVELGWGLLVRLAPAGTELPAGWQVTMAVLFISFAKPATTAAVVGREVIDRRRTDRLAAEAAVAERVEAAARLEADRLRGEQLRADRAAERAAERPAQPTPSAPPPPATGRVVMMSEEKAAREQRARELIAGGLKRRNALAEQSGLSKHRAAQLLDELAPGWNAKAA